ncbi:MAG TPA: hypothetical protein PLV52_00790 [Candidatus Omnitrophota bacterium]|nr:hypothetical protein [Candidatus Omnitrophota bacterium]
MRLFRKIASIGFVTMLALFYVHQHVELVKLSYTIQYNEKRVARLLDRNDRLGYNVCNLEDPSRLETILRGQKIDIVFPKRGQIVKASRAIEESQEYDSGERALEWKMPFRLFEFLGLRAEAQAKEK